MAQPGPPPGMPPGMTPQHIQQLIAMEAQKRGMTVPEFQAFQKQQIEQEAAKAGMSPQQFIQMKQAEAREQYMRQQQAAQQQQQQAGQPGQPPQQPPQQGQPGGPQPGQHMQQVPMNGTVVAKPEALAVAKFLRSQNLKTRTCIFDGQRKDMFKVKRALRALDSPAYEKARKKNQLLPPVTDAESARNTLALLPLSMLALRVTKKDQHEGHDHPKPKKEKRVKGLWDVKIEHQQEFDPMMHYIWLYEPAQWKTKIWAALLLLIVFAVVLFPLWPLFMRQGVWYLSVGAMGLLGVFFAMSIFRLILFIITYFAVPPGLWLFPNLFEDVSVIESFKPLWGWQETKKKGKKKRAIAAANGEVAATQPQATNAAPVASTNAAPTANGAAVTSGTEAAAGAAALARRHAAPTVEEGDDE